MEIEESQQSETTEIGVDKSPQSCLDGDTEHSRELDLSAEITDTLGNIQSRLRNLMEENTFSAKTMENAVQREKDASERVQWLERELCTSENKFKDQIRSLEDEIVTLKLQHEDKIKNVSKEKDRSEVNLMICQNEAKIAKEKLRRKIMEELKLESKINELERSLASRTQSENEAQRKLTKCTQRAGDLEQEFAEIVKTLATMEKNVQQAVLVNCDFQSRISAGYREQNELKREVRSIFSCKMSQA